MELIVKTLPTSIMALEVLVTVKSRPSTSVLPTVNSISEPLLKVLIQLMVGRGKPSAMQVREREAEGSRSLLPTGATRILGSATKMLAKKVMRPALVVKEVNEIPGIASHTNDCKGKTRLLNNSDMLN